MPWIHIILAPSYDGVNEYVVVVVVVRLEH